MAQTLAQLRTRLRERVDMVNSTFVTDAECNQLLNTAGARLHDLLITADPERYMASTPIPPVSGQEAYTLPATFHTLLKLWVTTGSGATLSRYPIRRFSPNDIAAFGNPYWLATSSLGPVVAYRLQGNSIYIEPAPTSVSGWSMELWYCPQYVEMLSDMATVDYGVILGWDEYMVNDAAVNIRLKEESDVSGLMARLQEFEMRVVTTAKYRDSAEPARVTDVTGCGNGTLGNGYYGS